MVLPLRFPPGMAGGLLLAYPRMKKAGYGGRFAVSLSAHEKSRITPTYGAGREEFSRLYTFPR